MEVLFCVPPAGGTASVFQAWPALLGGVAEVRPLELPGRGTRAAEPPCGGFQQAVEDLAARIRPSAVTGGWALFGHSMGGLLGYELVRQHRALGLGTPRCLVVSGCVAPQTPPDAAGVDDHLALGGLPPQLAEDRDAGAYFTDLVRQDVRLSSGYRHHRQVEPFACPVTVLLGTGDPVTAGVTERSWADAVAGPVTLRTIDAPGHFFPRDDPAATTAEVARALRPAAPDARAPAAERTAGGRGLYLDLLKRTLTNVIYEDPPVPSDWAPETRYDRVNRSAGLDWPSRAHTMVGLRRLDNAQHCVERILRDAVPGDLVETGVWRGGTCILLRAVLRAWGVTDRVVWAADSFQGMPDVGADAHPGDAELETHRFNDVMGVDLDTVRRNFAAYGLLDGQVRFLPGWFRDTLPGAPIRQLALIRLDGDLYESTMDALTALYPKLSVGGYVIVDDYIVGVCRKAVHDFRHRNGIHDPIEDIDGVGAFWRRGA